MDPKGNGHTPATTSGMGYHEKLDLILEGMLDIRQELEGLRELYEELVEKVENLNLEDDGFSVDYDS